MLHVNVLYTVQKINQSFMNECLMCQIQIKCLVCQILNVWCVKYANFGLLIVHSRNHVDKC